jgi:integrase
MPRCKLTTPDIAGLPPSPGRKAVLYLDIDFPGFGVRVSGNTKSYFVEGRPKGAARAVRITVGRTDKISLKQARDLARVRLGELAQGINANVRDRAAREAEKRKAVQAAQIPTLRGALDEYLAAHGDLRPITTSNYKNDFRLHFGDWLDRPAPEITRDMIEARYRKLCARPLTDWKGRRRKDAKGRPIIGGATSASRAFRYLRAVLAYALERYREADGTPILASGNPVLCLSALRLWKRPQRKTRFIPVQKLGALLDALAPKLDAKKSHDLYRNAVRDAFLLALLTGCRRSEVLTLEWNDVDLDTLLLTFPLTKNHRRHFVPIGQTVAAMLERRKGACGMGARFVFPAETKVGHVVSVWKPLTEICEATGATFSFHDARRSFVTYATEYCDISELAVGALINHASGNVTEGYTIRQIKSARRRLLQIENFILKAAGRAVSAQVYELRPAEPIEQPDAVAA